MATRGSGVRRQEEREGAGGGSLGDALKDYGVDTDVMADAAREKASGLQSMIEAEVKAHPLRALGVAAALGLFFGLMTTR